MGLSRSFLVVSVRGLLAGRHASVGEREKICGKHSGVDLRSKHKPLGGFYQGKMHITVTCCSSFQGVFKYTVTRRTKKHMWIFFLHKIQFHVYFREAGRVKIAQGLLGKMS